MLSNDNRIKQAVLRWLRWIWRSVKAFQRNQGTLLAGAVAFNTLLSLIPLMALLLVGLSHFIEPKALLETVHGNIALIAPAEADALTEQVAAFLDHRNVIGWIGTLVLLFFATIAFTTLEKAMSVIFHHRVEVHRRHFLVSVAIPFAFIFLIGIGIVLVTLINGLLQTFEDQQVVLLGYSWDLSGATGTVLYLLGIAGLILLMTLFYLLMPAGHISFRQALIGGTTAGLLWEVVRHLMVWYFSTLSLVNVIYGSLGTTIIALLSFEGAAMILLFGAQVIAEYDRLETEGENTGFET